MPANGAQANTHRYHAVNEGASGRTGGIHAAAGRLQVDLARSVPAVENRSEIEVGIAASLAYCILACWPSYPRTKLGDPDHQRRARSLWRTESFRL